MIAAGSWMGQYERDWFAPDVVAGLTAAAVVIPKALAYATIAGLPVQVGLYTAFIPPLVYALLGTSRNLSVTTTTTIAILAAAAIGEAVSSGTGVSLVTATATLSVLVGLMLLAARVLRLGFLASFISDPVLTGFKAGIGCVIVLDQLPKVLGIHIEKTGFFRDMFAIFATGFPCLAANSAGGRRQLRGPAAASQALAAASRPGHRRGRRHRRRLPVGP